MRYLKGVGVEYGTDWVIKSILEEEVTSIDSEEIFEDMVLSCYPEETAVGWLALDTVEILKSQDPISWRIAKNEYIDSLEQDEEIISFDSGATYYWRHELESLYEE